MDQAFTVTAGQFLLLCGMIIVGLVASWGITFYSMKGESKLAAALIADGLFLRMLTVVFVVCAVFGLGLVGRLTAEISTIFSGIVGYVLGSAKSDQSSKTQDAKGSQQTGSDVR